MDIETTPENTSSENNAVLDLYKNAILSDNSEKVKKLLDKGIFLDRNNSEIWSYIFVFEAYEIAKLLLNHFEAESILRALNSCKSISMLLLVLKKIKIEKPNLNIDLEQLAAAVAFNFSSNRALESFVERYLKLCLSTKKYKKTEYQERINRLWQIPDNIIKKVKPILEDLIQEKLFPDKYAVSTLVYDNMVNVLRFLITNENTDKSKLKQILKYSLFYVQSEEMAQLLISFGIDPSQTNKQKQTPAQFFLRNVDRDSPLWNVRCFFLKLDSEKNPNSVSSFMTEEVKMKDLVPLQQESSSFGIAYKDKEFKVSNRFFFSLSKIIPLDKKIFNYFLPEEIFLSISKKFPQNTFFLTFDLKEKVLLAIHEKQMLPPNQTIEYIEGMDNFIASYYHNGNYYAELSFGKTDYIDHSDNNEEKRYEYRALLSYPVDGLENIKMYPGFMDLKAKHVFYLCNHFLAHEYILDNREAYESFEQLLPRNRFNYIKYLQILSKIKQIPASVNEYINIDSFIENTVKDDVISNKIRLKMEQFVGDPCAFYNVTSLISIKVKFRKMLPVGCRVYDLFEFLITLQKLTNTKILDNLSVYGFLGEFLTKTFDLENVLTWENYLKIKNKQFKSKDC